MTEGCSDCLHRCVMWERSERDRAMGGGLDAPVVWCEQGLFGWPVEARELHAGGLPGFARLWPRCSSFMPDAVQ